MRPPLENSLYLSGDTHELGGESSPGRVVVKKTITKEANLESDCQEKAGLRWMEQGRGIGAGKNKQKSSEVETLST